MIGKILRLSLLSLFLFQQNLIQTFALVSIDGTGNVYIQNHGQVLGQVDIDIEKLEYEKFLEFYKSIESDLEIETSNLDPEKLYQAFEELKGKIKILQHTDGSFETRILDPEASLSSIAIVKGDQIESQLVMPDGSKESKTFQTLEASSSVEPVKQILIKPLENKKLEISGRAKNGPVPKIKDDQVQLQSSNGEEVIIVTNEANQLVFAQGKYGVATDYQVSIDSTDNNLVIQTPQNYLKVNALPGHVISSLKASGEIDEIKTNDAEKHNFDFLSEDTQILDLVQSENDLWYQVNGHKHVKILGIIPIKIDKTISVSVKNGQVQKIEQNLKDKLIDLISV